MTIKYENLIIHFDVAFERFARELEKASMMLTEWARTEREAPDSLLWTLFAMLVFIPTIMLWVRR